MSDEKKELPSIEPAEGCSGSESSSALVPHVLLIQVGAFQHVAEFSCFEESRTKAREALSRGFIEIEGEGSYLLVMSGPGSGVTLSVMTLTVFRERQMLAARAQAAAVQAQRQQAQGQRLVLPNGR